METVKDNVLGISKELVSAVLQIDIKDISIIGSTLNYTNPNHETEEDGELVYIDLGQNINIYEFAFKCKEWAFNNGGYVLQSQSYVVKDYKFAKGAFCYTHFPMGGIGNSHWADTEIEAIIKSCEWILTQKDKKC